MGKRLIGRIGDKPELKVERQKSRSLFTAKSVLTAGAVFAAALGYLTTGSEKGAETSWLNSASELAGQKIEGAGRYLISLLPAAGSAAFGGVLGFKRK